MLAITEDAAAAIRGIFESARVPEGAGLRITQEVTIEGAGTRRTDLRLSVVAAPQEGDEVLEEERIFIDPGATELLENRLLDAEIVDDEVRFSLDVQAEAR